MYVHIYIYILIHIYHIRPSEEAVLEAGALPLFLEPFQKVNTPTKLSTYC